MKPIDRLGLGPKREVRTHLDGYIVRVIPPSPKFTPSEVFLTLDQFRRYKQWETGAMLIQHALPELTKAQREMLVTGINDAEWKEMIATEEDENGEPSRLS